jgi:hypothetical protein
MATIPSHILPRHVDMLSYLVACQLVARERTGQWLRTDHLVESARMWQGHNNIACEWFDRVWVARASETLALKICNASPLLANQVSHFFDGCWIDYGTIGAQELRLQCVAFLRIRT